MRIFKGDNSQLSVAATERLQKILGGRTEPLGLSEPAQILVAPPSQAIRPIFKIVLAAVIITAALAWFNRPAPLQVPETISLYELTGSRVFRTDRDGDIAIYVQDSRIRVATRS
jgi:hypothetical protein